MENNKLVNTLNGEIYASRKEAKEKLGHSNFNKMLKKGEVTWQVQVIQPTEIII